MRSRTRLRLAVGAAAGLAPASCTAILGLGDYAVHPVRDAGQDVAVDAAEIDARSPVDASPKDVADAPDISTDVISCDVDLTVQCFPCAPRAPLEFLNGCTAATCVPFDDSTRLANLLPDGGLPPLPPFDGGG